MTGQPPRIRFVIGSSFGIQILGADEGGRLRIGCKCLDETLVLTLGPGVFLRIGMQYKNPTSSRCVQRYGSKKTEGQQSQAIPGEFPPRLRNPRYGSGCRDPCSGRVKPKVVTLKQVASTVSDARRIVIISRGTFEPAEQQSATSFSENSRHKQSAIVGHAPVVK